MLLLYNFIILNVLSETGSFGQCFYGLVKSSRKMLGQYLPSPTTTSCHILAIKLFSAELQTVLLHKPEIFPEEIHNRCHRVVFSLCIGFSLHNDWRMPFSGILHRMALVRTNVLEEHSASIIRVTRIGELGTALAITSNQCTLQRNKYFFVACIGC
jgi:hypothetical protein